MLSSSTTSAANAAAAVALIDSSVEEVTRGTSRISSHEDVEIDSDPTSLKVQKKEDWTSGITTDEGLTICKAFESIFEEVFNWVKGCPVDIKIQTREDALVTMELTAGEKFDMKNIGLLESALVMHTSITKENVLLFIGSGLSNMTPVPIIAPKTEEEKKVLTEVNFQSLKALFYALNCQEELKPAYTRVALQQFLNKDNWGTKKMNDRGPNTKEEGVLDMMKQIHPKWFAFSAQAINQYVQDKGENIMFPGTDIPMSKYIKDKNITKIYEANKHDATYGIGKDIVGAILTPDGTIVDVIEPKGTNVSGNAHEFLFKIPVVGEKYLEEVNADSLTKFEKYDKIMKEVRVAIWKKWGPQIDEMIAGKELKAQEMFNKMKADKLAAAAATPQA